MGFYGNITNTSNTTFQFDKVYPNRLAMDANVNNDGIFIGRYVLVEYDYNVAYPVVFIDENNYFYSSPNYETITRIRYGQSSDQIYLNDIVQNQEGNTIKYYKCNGSITEEVDRKQITYATFENIDDKSFEHTNYITNYQIDENHYYNVTDYTEISFKGYDSTVWVKTTVNVDDKLITKYVNIADMNSVVPTFDIAADAPTMEPLTPHFDADSTNVYYKLHMQTPFGFRVKETSADKSDEETIHYTTEYNINDNTTTTISEKVYADIFYNKDALTFKKNDTSNRITVNEPDEIKIVPTGKSKDFSTKYSHYSQGENVGDIQELSIHLPSIGYMVSQGWDIIHGPNRDDARTDENSSLQGRLDSFKEMEDNSIPVKRNDDGTFVGSRINGNQLREVPSQGILDEELSTSFDSDDAWIRTEINTQDLDNITKLSGISIHHTFHSKENTTSSSNKNTDNVASVNNYDKIELYTPIVDAAGHVVGKNTETVTLPYGYKTFTTEGLTATQDTDIWTINFGNVEDSNYNSSASSNQTKTIANNTQDLMAIEPVNKWIQTKFENDKLSIAHEIHGFNRTSNGHTNLNEESGAKQEDNLTIYDWEFDNAGHIIEKHKHTYTLPFGYKYIETQDGSLNDSTDLDEKIGGTATADNTQDALSINSYNKWIQIQVTDTDSSDNINIAHEIHDIETSEKDDTDLNDGTDTITIQDLEFDNAGHVTHNQKHTYTLPFGYKSFTDGTNTSTAVETQDEFKFVGDSWLLPIVSKDIITYTHIGPVAKDTRDIEAKEPKFGETFEIEDWVFDEKGHKTNVSKHTVKIPKGSLNGLTATGSSVLTGISMIDETGVITQTNADVGTLTLKQYQQGQSGNLVISDTNTINGAFKGVQDYINKLDMEDASTTQFISKITQIDGKIAVERAVAGTLILGSESADKTVSATDSLNAAINKIEARIKTEEENRKNAIDTLYGSNGEKIAETFDSIKEIADWLDNDSTTGSTGVEKLISDINNNTSAITDETNRADLAEKALGARIDNLDYEKTQANDYYISSIKQTDGLIEVGTTILPIRTVDSGTDNGTILVNGSVINVGGLKSAAFTESSAYATAEQGAAADNAVSKEVYETKIQQLENKITELENTIIKILENYPLPDEESETPAE